MRGRTAGAAKAATQEVARRVRTLEHAAARASTAPAPPTPAEATGPLSAREREIVGLIARRLTSRELADPHHIAKRTVDKHANRVKAKLGVASRAEAAAWLARHEAPATNPATAPHGARARVGDP